jgi:adenosylcobinamide-GDP ribazoletransferase
LSFLTALGFLTVIPVGRDAGPQALGRSLAFFPLVGLLLGLLLAGADLLLGFLPGAVANCLLLVLLALATGGLHLDGFIDTCDGLVGMKKPHERWEIMNESRVGGFGVIGAVLLLLVKYAALGALSQRLGALILMPVLGRWAGVLAISAFPHAKPEGLGRNFKDAARPGHLVLASLLALALSLALFRLEGLALMLGVGVLAWAFGLYLKGRFAGLTGDNYGALIEAGEACFLLLVIAFSRWSWG